MNDPRPYPPTDWEEEKSQDAADAADRADAAVVHADEAMKELVESSKQIAASTTAVEKLTRESLIADNKKFRRRNSVLVFLLSVNLILMSVMVSREVLIVGPQRDDIEEIALTLEECTTPGPREPTPDDPTTGHDCFDRGRTDQAVAIAQIVDADGNGKIDTQEILAAIAKFEVILDLIEDRPTP